MSVKAIPDTPPSVSCTREGDFHSRGMMRVIDRTYSGHYVLECGHTTKNGSLMHCSECGGQMIQCWFCTPGTSKHSPVENGSEAGRSFSPHRKVKHGEDS